LLRILEAPAGEAATIVKRFSILAVAAVIVLVAAGLVLAVLQLDGDWLALLTTGYGQLLLLKVLLVALLLLLASYNKGRLTPALARGEDGAAERLARAIRLEIVAVGLILAIAALLGQTPPPRAVPAGDRSIPLVHGGHRGHRAALAQHVTAESKGYRVTAMLTPSRVGRNTLSIALRGPDGAPFAALEARAEFSLPEAGVDSLPLYLRSIASGRYEGATDALIVPGPWQVHLTVLINDFEQVSFDLTLPVH
jgi:copper transport protein